MEEVSTAVRTAAAPEKSEPKKRRDRRHKPRGGRTIETSATAEVLPTDDSCGVSRSEREDATAAGGGCASTVQLSEGQRAASRRRRRRRRKLRGSRAPSDVDSAAPVSSIPVGACGQDAGNASTVGAGNDPIATVGPDGAVTFTIEPQGAHSSEEYSELLQWLRDARAAADLPTATEDVNVTFTIHVSPRGGAPSTSPTNAAIVVPDAANAAAADVTVAELLRETPTSRKRRNRRRRLKSARFYWRHPRREVQLDCFAADAVPAAVTVSCNSSAAGSLPSGRRGTGLQDDLKAQWATE